MNIKSVGNVLVLAKNERQGNNRQMYYNLAIMSDGEAGDISCTQEAYDKAEVYKPNDVVFAYNEQYKSFRVVDVIPPAYEPEIPFGDENAGAEPAQNMKSDAVPDIKQDAKQETKQAVRSDKSAK